ncbi:MAG: HD family phosphohydrolase [Acidobacteriota bacterium]
MSEISTYVLAVLVGVALFGAVLALIRYFHTRRLRSAAGAIRQLAVRDLGKVESEEAEFKEAELARPSLYGIPYLAWIVTSLVIPAAFFLLFFANLVPPYGIPEVDSVAWHSYTAPISFQAQGRLVERHEILIPQGTRVSESQQALVEEALRNRGRVNALQALGTVLLLAVFFFILLYHINILYPTSTEKNKNLILIYLTILIVLASAKVSLFYGLFSPYLIPVPWAGMIITIFINRRVVPLIMLVTLIFVSIASDFDFSLFLVLLAGGLVSGSWVRQARKRSQVMAASIFVGAIMALVFFCYSMLVSPSVYLLHEDAIASFINGIISGLLTLTVLPLFEMIFDLASPFRLMELLDLNTPPLKEFFFKAPGTYQHSMVVANIAETVANEIGANGLLVRVGAYYHDIGKMFNPDYFVENQAEGISPHDELGPVASAAMVRSHVILGVKLARHIGLPSAAIDFIPEHHGTSTIDYFYYKSKQLDSEIKSERVFKYPGPKPQSKETAIVMLVDSVEAAFRVHEERDEEKIRQLINRVAQRKLEQGELDRSGLKIGELKKITDTLTHILKSSKHQRIPYPTSVSLQDDDNIRQFSPQQKTR